MGLIRIIKNWNKSHQQLMLIFSVIAISLIAYLFLWPIVEQSSFIIFISNFTGKLVVAISSLLGFSVQFNSISGIVQYAEKSIRLVLPVGAYSYYFTILFLFFLVPLKKHLSVIALCIFTFLFLAFRAASITTIFLIYKGQSQGIVPLFLDPLIYLPMFLSLLFIIQNNETLNIQFKKLVTLFSSIINTPLHFAILLLILIPPLPRVLLTIFNVNIINSIVTFTLKGSQIILNMLGFDAYVSTKYLMLNQHTIQLEHPCLGMGVITIIYIFIFVLRANWLNKAIFLAIFTVFFSLMNSFRLAMTLIYLQNISEITKVERVTIHDAITYFMYLVAFGSLVVFHFWFQDLKLTKTAKINKPSREN